MIERVLPLVVRLERDTPPGRTDALEAAAQAVLAMVSTDEPEWVAAVAEWDGYRIRKVVRRARGIAWERATALPGITIEHGGAQVRVYPPIGLDDWPPDLAKLQVGGTDLLDPEPPMAPDPTVPLVLLAPEVEMTAGKAMAQAGHAAQLGYRAMDLAGRQAWREAGFPVAVRDASPQRWREAIEGGVVVHDAGFTEVAPGSATAAFVAARSR